MDTLKSTEQFIQKVNKVHNFKYNYSNVKYINTNTKVCIICPIHGEFKQIPKSHLKGHGCPRCKADKIGKLSKHSKDKFIEKAIAVHGNKYDYSKVEYKDSQTKVKYICPDHGEFTQTPNHHLRGIGCFHCGVNLRIIGSDKFIQNARVIHGDKYNYEKVEYIHNKNKVIITCKKHGDFLQRPSGHLQGKGCPICKASKGEIIIKDILDKNNIKNESQFIIPNQIYTFRYDFYLPDFNILIEFHGKQHYIPVEYFGGEETLNYIKKNDMFKRYLAKELNYKLIEFNYKHLKISKEDFEILLLKRMELFKPRVANIALRQSSASM